MSDNSQYLISSAIKQTEQVNGYYLIAFELAQTVSFEQLLGRTFKIVSLDNNVEENKTSAFLSLFLMPSKFSNAYQFLSTQPLPKKYLDDTQKGLQFFLQRELLLTSPIFIPENNKPCVILANTNLLANAFALAKWRQQSSAKTVVFLHATSFPFMPKPARFWAPEMPDEAIGASSLLEDWGIINRLATDELVAGCFQGPLELLYNEWRSHIHNADDWQTINLTATNV